MGIDSGDVFDRVVADETVTLAPGDGILLYTDGATEALDPHGSSSACAAHPSRAGQRPEEVPRRRWKNIADELREFAGVVPQYDDITLISIRKL